MAGGTWQEAHSAMTTRLPASERGSRPGRTDRRGAGTPPGTARSGSPGRPRYATSTRWKARAGGSVLLGTEKAGCRRGRAVPRPSPPSAEDRDPVTVPAHRTARSDQRAQLPRKAGAARRDPPDAPSAAPATPPRRRMAEIWIGRSSLPSPTRKASLKISTTRTRGVPFAAATGLRKESGGREMSIGRAGGHWLAGQLQGFRVGSRVSQIGATQLRSRPIGRRGLPRGSVGGSRTFLPCPPLASRPTEVGLGEGRLSRSRLQHARRLPRAWVRVPCCLTSTPRHPVDPSFRPGPAARPSLSARAESFAPLSLSVRSLAGPFTAETRPGPGPGPGPTGPSPADPTSPPGRLAPVLPGLVPTGGS